jgi:UDP-glucose 4-epimerase
LIEAKTVQRRGMSVGDIEGEREEMKPGNNTRVVLVTGGCGFLASYLIPALVAKGATVIAFDVSVPSSVSNEPKDRVHYVRGDLASEADIYRLMIKYRFTDVFHLGGLLAEVCEADPVRAFKVNFLSTLTLLDASVSLGVQRFVMTSSISVFGQDAEEPVKDDAPKNPTTVYGQTKLASEHLLLWYARKHDLDTRGVRFAWVFGPGRKTGITATWSSLLLDAIAEGRPVEIFNPEERGDWLYVKDAVKALLAVWQAQRPLQRIYNIAGGVHSIREVMEIARRYRPETKISWHRKSLYLSPYPAAYDDGPARAELGWKPDYTIERAVKEHLDVVSSRRNPKQVGRGAE